MLEGEGRRYRILETIGRGGFGTVYKAELVGQGGFVKLVALKVLNDAVAGVEGTQERLRDEARMLGLLRHRAIVNVDGLLQLDGRWTVVMEYVEGVDLKQLLAQGPVPVGVALEIIQEVASALYVAYERPMGASGPMRLLHRDIKPSNVLLSAAGEVKILDFGVARAEFEAREARTSAVAFGSLGYMAPERLENENSHAGDVYALGAVLFELIVGEPLGRTHPEPDLHDMALDRALEKLWAVVQDEDLYQLVGECLAYDPAVRPPARELERRLRAVRVRFAAPWLSDWAEHVVPEILAGLPRGRDERAGSVLTESVIRREQTPSPTLDPVLPPPAPALDEGTLPELPVATPEPAPVPAEEEEPEPTTGRTAGVVGVLSAVFGATVVVGVGLALLAWLMVDRRDEAADPGPAQAGEVSAPTTSADAAVQEPVEPVVAEPAPVEPVVAEPAPEPTPEPTPAPAPEPTPEPTPTPRATTSKASYGQVILLGDLRGVVRLYKGSKSYSAGRVPAGTYTLRSTTDASGASLGEVTVKANQTVTATCKTGFPFCVVGGK